MVQYCFFLFNNRFTISKMIISENKSVWSKIHLRFFVCFVNNTTGEGAKEEKVYQSYYNYYIPMHMLRFYFPSMSNRVSEVSFGEELTSF